MSSVKVAHRSSRAGELTESAYVRAIALFTLLEAALAAGASYVSYSWQMSWFLVLGSFVASILFIFMFTGSKDPLVSGVGVSGMSISMGLMIGPLVAIYSSAVVLNALVTTAVVMIVMSVIGIMFPTIFRGWGPFLLAGLTLLIVAQFTQIIFIVLGFSEAVSMPVLTWFGIILFIGIVAWDWALALDQPHTWDNVIDASGGLVLDAINLFIRFLEVFKDVDIPDVDL